jgi:hypothetical protein
MNEVRVIILKRGRNEANINQALDYAKKYDFPTLQKTVTNRKTEQIYCPLLSKYVIIYSGGRAAIYVHKTWNIATL